MSHARAGRAAADVELEIERQASKIAVLERRLEEARRTLGQTTTIRRVEGLSGLGPEHYAPPLPAPEVLPHGAGYWPTRPALVPHLDAKPGHRSRGLRGAGLPVLAVSVCGLERAACDVVILEVEATQARQRHFVPLFLTDRSHDLDLFRKRGYSVELLPEPAALRRCPTALDPATALRRRLAAIAFAWGIDRFVDRGHRPLPWPEPDVVPAKTPLFFCKDYRRYNPYQHLLYATLPGHAASPGTIEEASAWLARSGPPVVFHLNWEEALYRDAETEETAQRLVDRLLAELEAFRGNGGCLLWTVHNKSPHENAHPEVHRRLAGRLAGEADLVHVHSPHMAEWAARVLNVTPSRLVLAPHGNYRQALGRALPTMHAARRRLNLPATGRLIGMIGNLRPYKGGEMLLHAYLGLRPGEIGLVLAGRQTPPMPVDLLAEASARGVIVEDRALDHDDVANYVAACDGIVLPYREAGTSGAVLLAFTLGRPVIVPDLPGFLELVADYDNGLVYAHGARACLTSALRRFAGMDEGTLKGMKDRALATARRFDWAWIGRRISAALARAEAAGPADRSAWRPAALDGSMPLPPAAE